MTNFSDLVDSFCASVESYVNERLRNALLGALSSSTTEPVLLSSFFPPEVEVRRGPGRPRKNPEDSERGSPAMKGHDRAWAMAKTRARALWSRGKVGPEDSVAKKKKPGSPAMKAHGRYVGLLNWARHRGLPSHLTAAAKIKASKGSKAAGDFLAGLRDKAGKKLGKAKSTKTKSAKTKSAKTKIVVVNGAKLSRKVSKAAKAVAKAVKRANVGKPTKTGRSLSKEASGNGLAFAE
jgi:hypothetical protein